MPTMHAASSLSMARQQESKPYPTYKAGQPMHGTLSTVANSPSGPPPPDSISTTAKSRYRNEKEIHQTTDDAVPRYTGHPDTLKQYPPPDMAAVATRHHRPANTTPPTKYKTSMYGINGTNLPINLLTLYRFVNTGNHPKVPQ